MPDPRHVCIVAIPDAVVSTLSGIYDVLNAFHVLDFSGTPPPFRITIVGEQTGPLRLASGIPIEVQRAVADVEDADLVIVPSILLPAGGWTKGRYPELLDWIARMHARGAVLCSACSGIYLLAETGLWDGRDATIHYGFVGDFSPRFPTIRLHPERVLVISGLHEDLVCSGASMTWHDLVLYLIARYAGVTAAQEVARTFALQWHQDGLTPYIVFEGNRDHGDAEILEAQTWLSGHFADANPVQEMIERSRLAERTFKRRFQAATGLAPIVYVQRLRIEDAKRRLERTEASVEEIGFQVGYEDPAFFRRLFKRTTGLAPGAYRKRFRVPDFAR
jgi:transcriptional regulator GlxA family with amidase domain